MRRLNSTTEQKLHILRRNIYFDNLDETILRQVAEQMELYVFERGESLFWEGEPCAGLHIIEKGSIKLYRLSPQGRQYIVRVLQEGDTCNEVPVFDGGKNPVNVEALEKTHVWIIRSEPLYELSASIPEFSQRVIQNLSHNLRNLVQMVSEMAFFQVTHRLARLISQLSLDELNGRNSSRLTQEQIAARLGTVREVVSRSLRELERSGAIRVNRSCIEIADPGLLAQWVDGPGG